MSHGCCIINNPYTKTVIYRILVRFAVTYLVSCILRIPIYPADNKVYRDWVENRNALWVGRGAFIAAVYVMLSYTTCAHRAYVSVWINLINGLFLYVVNSIVDCSCDNTTLLPTVERSVPLSQLNRLVPRIKFYFTQSVLSRVIQMISFQFHWFTTF